MPRNKKAELSKGAKGKGLQPAKKSMASQKIARKSAPVTTGVKPAKKRLSKPGSIALKEIKKYQKSTQLLIARAPFQRRIRQIADEFSKATHDEYQGPNRDRGIRFQAQALAAIQEAVESSIASLYEDANLCCSHAKRVTLFDRDVILARRIRGDAF